MLMALDRFGISCFVRIPKAVVLSNSRGVLGWRWPISINITRNSIPILVFTYTPAISASDAAPMIFCRILDSTCIGALMNTYCWAKGLVGSGTIPRKWYPLTRLLAFGIERYEESDDIQSIISDALYVIEGLG